MGNGHSVRVKKSDLRETYRKQRFQSLNESLSNSRTDLSAVEYRPCSSVLSENVFLPDSEDEERHLDSLDACAGGSSCSEEVKIFRGIAGRYGRSSSHYDETDRRARRADPAKYSFQFENLVFEGGGNKGLAYCGAIKYLEEIGMMQQIKSFAGSSAGGMMAALLAVGYKADEVEQFLSDRIDEIFIDHSCGYCSLLPNLLRDFGWNPGNKIYNWFGDKLQSKTNNADLTFKELYHVYGKMLCIVVTNLSQMTTEYCHPKTTPDMPIRVAVRMSLAIPGLFSAMRYEHYGRKDVYVDGGVLCNYPIHCFDGWYLSMEPQNSFVRRLQPLQDIPIIMERSNRFGEFNPKTLGMLLYADGEDDILRFNLERRADCLLPREPRTQTKLYLQRAKEAKVKERAIREHAKVVCAVDNFLKVLKKYNIDRNDVISRSELENAFKDEKEFPKEQAELLFGANFTVQEAFDLLDRDKNGQIRYDELVHFIEENGVCLQTRFLGYQRKDITNFVTFLDMLQNTLVFNVKKLYVESRDLERTVGINTGHVATTDFVLEEADREFVVERGYYSMLSFLRYYVVKHPDMVKLKGEQGSDLPPILENTVSVTPPTTDNQEPSEECFPFLQGRPSSAKGNNSVGGRFPHGHNGYRFSSPPSS